VSNFPANLIFYGDDKERELNELQQYDLRKVKREKVKLKGCIYQQFIMQRAYNSLAVTSYAFAKLAAA
jgi:hypothetical protein